MREIGFGAFQNVQLRVGRVVRAEVFSAARKPT
jgi:hypothetical protein